MKGLSTLIISWCNFHCSSTKQLGFYSVFLWYVCVCVWQRRFLSNVWKSVEMLCNQPSNLMLSWTTGVAVEACECALSICAYDNEAGDAFVCLTVRACIMQFIHLMRPTYSAILICFQGERSNISETTQPEPSFNKSAPCSRLLEALSCFVGKRKHTKKTSSKQTQYVFQKCSNISLSNVAC